MDPFVGLEWEPYDPPEPDPFDADERDRILAWLRDRAFWFHAGRGASHRMQRHPSFHAYIHFLFLHGARPSEASGLRWGNVDLRRGRALIRQSYHMGRYGKPKTKAARRTIELHPETVLLLRALQPATVTPDTPVFVNVEGTPIEPKTFSVHWYECLRALGLRQRGLYCAKDTFVTLTLDTGSDRSAVGREPDGRPLRDAPQALREVPPEGGSRRVGTHRSTGRNR